MKSYEPAEDLVIETKFDNPAITWSELKAALASIGSNRTEKGIESRYHNLKQKRSMNGKDTWLNCPFLTGKKRSTS
jgi:hypothetical protein